MTEKRKNNETTQVEGVPEASGSPYPSGPEKKKPKLIEEGKGKPHAPSHFRKLFTDTRVSALTPPLKSLVVLQHINSVAQALTTLSRFSILSAPVIDTERNICLGAVDVLDLVFFVVCAGRIEYIATDSVSENLRNRFYLPLDSVLHRLQLSSLSPFTPISDNVTLQEVICNFLKFGIHRVPVTDASTGNIVSILSQMDLLIFLLRQGDLWTSSPLAQKTLTQLKMVPRPVVTVRDDDTLLSAFQEIAGKYVVSGVGVVDKEGRLIGNLSATDFNGFNETNYKMLERTVKEYCDVKDVKLFSCGKEATVNEVVQMMTSAAVHRVYVVNAEGMAESVVSVTDIMMLLASEISPE